MTLKTYFSLIGLCFSLTLVGQQTPQYSLFMLDKSVQNPAFVGMENTLVATGHFRSQWIGIPENPVSQAFNVHMPLSIIKSGIGFQVDNNELGASNYTQFQLNYSYQLALGRKSVLSIGLGAQIQQYKLDGSKLRTPDGDYNLDQNVIIHNDALLENGTSISNNFNTNLGLYWLTEKLEIGLGINNLTEQKVQLDNATIQLDRTIHLSGFYKFFIGRNFELKPHAQIKTNLDFFQVEIGAFVLYQEKFGLGAGYRGFTKTSLDAAILLFSLRLNEKWTIGYTYDIGLSKLNTVNQGSHEVSIQYNLGKPIGNGIPPPLEYNPRY